jgi:hypothetical protein
MADLDRRPGRTLIWSKRLSRLTDEDDVEEEGRSFVASCK